MGQKTHPIGFRLGTTRTWSSRWFATKNYAALLHEDVKIRRFIKDQLYHAGIAKIDIERYANRARITIFTARPGIVIGRKGAEIDKLKEELSKLTGKEIYVDIVEVKQPETDAQLVAENIALQLQRDVFRDKLRVGLRLFHFHDVDVDLLAGQLRKFFLQLVDLRALAADDDAGTRRKNRDARTVRIP